MSDHIEYYYKYKWNMIDHIEIQYEIRTFRIYLTILNNTTNKHVWNMIDRIEILYQLHTFGICLTILKYYYKYTCLEYD